MNLYKLHNNPDELVGYTDRNFYLGDEARDLLLQGKKLTKHIVGNVDLNNDLITALPDNLHITGDLWLIDTPIKTIGKNLSVGGNLLLTNTQITSLPDNLSVGEDLYLNDTPIKTIGKNLSIGGSLNLAGTPITTLPDISRIDRNLLLNDSQITSLPDNLSVGGNLLLTNTPIASLPDNLSVGMHLYINGTPNLDKNNLPSSLAVKGAITGTGDGALIGKLLGG